MCTFATQVKLLSDTQGSICTNIETWYLHLTFQLFLHHGFWKTSISQTKQHILTEKHDYFTTNQWSFTNEIKVTLHLQASASHDSEASSGLLYYVVVVSRKSTMCLFDRLLIISDYLPARFLFTPSRFGNICCDFMITMLKMCPHIPEIEGCFSLHTKRSKCISSKHEISAFQSVTLCLQPEAEQISQEPTSAEFVNVEASRINSSGDIFSPRKRQTQIQRVTKLYFDLLRTTGSAHTTWPIYLILLVFLYCQHLSDVRFQPLCVRVSLSRAQERVFRSDGVQLCRVAQSNLFSPRALFHRSYDRTCETEKGGRADTQRK